MARSKLILSIIALFLLFLLIGLPLAIEKHYMAVSILFVAFTFLPFMIRFEKRKVTGRELVILAVLASIAAVSRVPFAAIPSVQPTTFVIIVTGIVFGAESGFVVGALAALVSNLFLGQGPWTPWQMYAWGMIGLSAGLLRNTWIMRRTIGRCLFGIITGFMFGWFTNIWIILGMIGNIQIAQIIAYFATSFYFDLAHALSNVFFLFIFGKSWVKILQRFKTKYGLLSLVSSKS